MIRLLAFVFRRIRRSHGTQLFRLSVLTVALLWFSSSGFLFFELADRPDLTWSDALWWSVVTMTTVGYGDLFPETPGGRYLIGFPTMLFGISVLGYLLSVTATLLIEAREKELRGMGEAFVKDHILLIHYPGLNRARSVVNELRSDAKTARTPIVLIDAELESLPEALAHEGVHFIRGVPSKPETLRRAGLDDARAAIILARDHHDPASDHHGLAVVLTLEQMSPETVTTAECVEPDHIHLFKRAGADDVVCIAEFASNLIIQETLDPGVQRVLRELTSNTYGQQVYVVAVEGERSGRFGDAKSQLSDRETLAIGLKRGDTVLLNPGIDDEVQPQDQVVCIGPRRPPAVRF